MSDVSRYDYALPRELISQDPLPIRSDARLMLVERREQRISHRHVRELPELLDPRDCLVVNDTRVLPARLVGRRSGTGGAWEGLFLEADANGLWQVLGKTRGKIRPGETVTLLDRHARDSVALRLVESLPGGVWVAKPETDVPTLELLDRVGRVPLPHYIRHGEMVESDRLRYQTVFARNPGSVAAPTAGLHITNDLLNRLVDRGVMICRVTLHVGMGTFRPIGTATIEEHRMHGERGVIDAATVAKIEQCRAGGGRVVALGTTSVRLLETAAQSGTLCTWSGETKLYIRPLYQFKIVDALMTNFHLPRTTLLVLVRTFGGEDLIVRAYEEAIAERYRFYSYGDAMLIV
ncbi:MAG TPA: tRNA preQ1(34) S-adenosylmethionine ribosyltransferase-isomerase QueA [Pirellulales bacterium]|jgi:S-adenosylmethionine:tRNA ribosyltransferase-isomerase|nr:tRNA preQ1(34) S-adenosylmethionine ribosyltransferase-isomerase QueA [Pirellulales bacterium]